MSGDIKIRPAIAGDEADWRRLWAGYLSFYETALAPAVTDATWARVISEDTADIGSLVAERADVGPVGILNYVVHDLTWSIAPACYLEDLFVEEEHRGQGIARMLIERLVEMGRSEGWFRIYWHTARDNVQAQILYNKVAERTGWVRYDIDIT